MQWQNGRRSDNVEDRRGFGGRRAGLAIGGGGTLIVALIALLLGQNPLVVIGQLAGGAPSDTQVVREKDPAQDRLADMCSVVLADTEDTWHMLFKKMGRTYVEPKLVIFSDYVQTASGAADSSTGPFYSPGDQTVYIDLSFYDELQRRFEAPGDFAQAYVIAHEVGHHVQNLLGILDKAHTAMSRGSKTQANKISVALELQADYFAGIWAHYATQSKNLRPEPGDIEEALNAASAIGDDRLQRRAQGYVVPDSFTHGSSAQRHAAFKAGFESGNPAAFKEPR